MAITVVPSVVTGQTYSAANFNTHIRDNINGIWVLTTAGDMLYATSSSAAARLALVPGGVLYGGASAPAWLATPAATSMLKKNSGTDPPVWLASTLIPGRLHTKGQFFGDSLRGTTSTTFVDVTGFTFDLTLTGTCTIVGRAFGLCYTLSGAQHPSFAVNIDGTDDPNPTKVHKSTTPHSFFTEYVKSSVAAGTRTVKLRFKIPSGDTVNTDAIKLEAFAFVED